ncbi:MAG: hypothetical protein HF981_07365 [Desulfobacteraceae bacterium]|nr:hypothetical protein [Desulfobacteraceae bacterium]MBC2750187.1 hypothetical protein [Desulfobacteraceae bacterium]
MATELSNDELVSFKELLMANEIYFEALVLLLIDKGILTKEELYGKIKQVQSDMLKKKGQ